MTLKALKTAAVMVGTLPVLFVYPFLQRYFVKGVLVGSIKG
jgi:putative aldouronate transport system permease protein